MGMNQRLLRDYQAFLAIVKKGLNEDLSENQKIPLLDLIVRIILKADEDSAQYMANLFLLKTHPGIATPIDFNKFILSVAN